MVHPRISNHQKSRLPEGCLDLVSEVSRSEPVIGVTPVEAAHFSTAHWPLFLDDMILISQVFNGNKSMRYQQKLLSGSFGIYDVDAITFLFGDVLFHLEVKVGIT